MNSQKPDNNKRSNKKESFCKSDSAGPTKQLIKLQVEIKKVVSKRLQTLISLSLSYHRRLRADYDELVGSYTKQKPPFSQRHKERLVPWAIL